MDYSNYRKCAAALVFYGNQIVLFRDNNYKSWGSPQGGIEDGENPEDAIIRELIEETGTSPQNLVVEFKVPELQSYIIPEEKRGKREIENGYVGQVQNWFFIRVKSLDDFNLSGASDVCFDEIKLFDPSEIIPLIIPMKRNVYENIIPIFKKFISKL
jgi:putative (di)nucleoside polyphosphate hydrolase